ncbi:hypothetical protein JTE90_010146 [Oedothorax gibbosus]|uniref:Uncharacterized protein n=1 Tax=Oedothorax gibbosus TaxID=931172 RepID=A0AAV6UGS3_9ARAC|nr:hypothetical protein JTE90_010146 [Oedothorax gibbosus]
MGQMTDSTPGAVPDEIVNKPQSLLPTGNKTRKASPPTNYPDVLWGSDKLNVSLNKAPSIFRLAAPDPEARDRSTWSEGDGKYKNIIGV